MIEKLFNLAFPAALPFWALIILVPGWSWTRRIIASPLIVLVPLAVYLATVATILPEFAAEMVSPDLAGVQALLSTPAGTATAWAHLIAFDLFIGRWMYLDSRESRITRPSPPVTVGLQAPEASRGRRLRRGHRRVLPRLRRPLRWFSSG